MAWFKKRGKGIYCRENEDGTTTCGRYVTENDEQLATGSEATIAIDPKTCKARFVGSMKINDEDRASMVEMAKSMEESCKKGF